MSRGGISGHFIEGSRGPIFVLLRRPAGEPRGCVLVVPPMAEEMNKSRRSVTETCIGLSRRGIATVVPDLFGTGDSCGDFSAGDWSHWQDDLARTAHWSADQGCPVSALLAIRLGAGLAADAVSSGKLPAGGTTVLWQPLFDGGRWLTQFLRLRVVSAMMEEDRSETLAQLRGRLAGGETIEIAGYGLSGNLATSLGRLTPPSVLPTQFGRVHWMEVVRELGLPLPEAAVKLIDRTNACGNTVQTDVFVGEPFWSSTEIVTIPAMIDATISSLSVSAQAHG